jgi:hypothetical protein
MVSTVTGNGELPCDWLFLSVALSTGYDELPCDWLFLSVALSPLLMPTRGGNSDWLSWLVM